MAWYSYLYVKSNSHFRFILSRRKSYMELTCNCHYHLHSTQYYFYERGRDRVRIHAPRCICRWWSWSYSWSTDAHMKPLRLLGLTVLRLCYALLPRCRILFELVQRVLDSSFRCRGAWTIWFGVRVVIWVQMVGVGGDANAIARAGDDKLWDRYA
jgi:hypothetical protein